MQLQKIISGGQTGVDQAALDIATIMGLSTGGWCPPGRICEDGLIPARFHLNETPEETSSRAPHIRRSLRTEWNVRDADATLVIRSDKIPMDPGTSWTLACIEHFNKPALVIDMADKHAAERIRVWLDDGGFRVLNVAGPSESLCPGISEETKRILAEVINPERFPAS